MITENLSTLQIHKLTQAQYDRLVSAGTVNENALYLTPDESGDYMSATNPVGSGSFSMNRVGDVGERSSAIGSGTEASGFASHAEGSDTIASGFASHAEGDTSSPDGYASHAEGSACAAGDYSHAEGSGSATYNYSHAEGYGTKANNIAAHAEGDRNTASGYASHAEGGNTNSTANYSHSEGYFTYAQGDCSHSEGYYAEAKGMAAHAEGYKTLAKSYQHASGKYNVEKNEPASYDTQDASNTDAIFLVGCGTSSATKNALRITSGGKCYGSAAFGGTGADFAELFEWVDGNPDDEDRRGLFVTLDGEKIRLANANDDYIGVISGDEAFIGNTASEEWQGKYLTDVFGTKLSHEVEVPAIIDEETGEIITPSHTAVQYVVNPNYNPDEEYIMRENRKEWGTVGLLGQVVVIDDGTCVVGGYVKPSVNGMGTASNNGYRVMKRIDENHIKVLVK